MQGYKYPAGEKPTSLALVALGSNLPAGGLMPAAAVSRAMDLLEDRTRTALRRSRLWRTPAFPPGAGPPFVNAAAALDWGGAAEDLLAILHGIEAAFGRQRSLRWEARIMDLDLLALGDKVLPDRVEFERWSGLSGDAAAAMTPDRLILPHPRLAERAFVLAPLADVAPDWRHPVTGDSVSAILAALPASALEGVEPLDPAG
ncbi:2-amino-4-hydroxy-6-hydroxymethyldihydropteridine diphosphokinase [Roseibacterium sp. SDUM158017]|uniref:2-amino-4-hydroxy-6- hydroxymethyldihydropteridine diphosphokinase n=1 Tax=Roseicyclus salinarum TaxID=3036773 RepID=UPI002415710A|nr:2-amino-4-hydroxy-6-hydroxymethyldihydropteridine diphosphokinase [Roseibacterium sp. SDUM158017]MDG4649031.1 2-amino-4-hydroxy-6-hydroxymethyldihydropteridine diphosphokinase [Roseibacterium sp. SDUM158017]